MKLHANIYAMTTAYRVQEWRRPLRSFRRNWNTCILNEEDLPCDVINIHFIVYDTLFDTIRKPFRINILRINIEQRRCVPCKKYAKNTQERPQSRSKTFPRFDRIQQHNSSNRYTHKKTKQNHNREAALERAADTTTDGLDSFRAKFQTTFVVYFFFFFFFLTKCRLERSLQFIWKIECQTA